MIGKIGKKAQTTAEYAILIGLVVAAVLAMQVYVKRGLHGRMKDAVDSLQSGTSNIGATTQYEPYYLNSTSNSYQNAQATENMQTGGAINRDQATNAGVNREQKYGW